MSTIGVASTVRRLRPSAVASLFCSFLETLTEHVRSSHGIAAMLLGSFGMLYSPRQSDTGLKALRGQQAHTSCRDRATDSWPGTVIHLRFGTAIYFFARQSGGRAADRLVWLLALGLIPLAALTWWRFSFPPAPETVLGGVIEWGSALPGFINVRHFGSWTGAIAAGLMIQLAYGEERPRPATDALYVFAFGLTCWSGTRAALVGMAAVAVITSVSLRRLPSPVRLVRLGGLTAAAYLLAIAFRFDNVDFLLFVPSDTAGADAMSGGRLALWRATLESWSRSPLFGWGSGSTFWEVDIGWRHTQPHNVILQYLISWGPFGAIGGLWLLGRLILATHRAGITDERLRPLIAVHYCLIVMSLLEGMLYYPRFIMPIAATFAIILAARGEKDRERRCQC